LIAGRTLRAAAGLQQSLHLPRSTPTGGPGEYSRVIQVAEALGKAWTVLQETYTAAAWTDEPFSDTSKTVQVDVPSRYDRIYLK
jgi:hypothetical protein